MANGLTHKQRIWLDVYLQCWNATEAARQAGYKQAERSGYQNKTSENVKQAIHKRLSASAMSAGEALERLGKMGRFDVADLWIIDDDGARPNWSRILAGDFAGLIKSIRQTSGGWQIEVYDAQRAVELIAKHHGLFVDKQEHSWDRDQLRELLRSRLRKPASEPGEGGAGSVDAGCREGME